MNKLHNQNLRRSTKLYCFFLPLFALATYWIFFRFYRIDLKKSTIKNNFENEEDLAEKINWYNGDFVRMESTSARYQTNTLGYSEARVEQEASPPSGKCDEDELYKSIGYNGCLSDNISVNRFLPDTRPETCQQKIEQRTHFPKVSVIIPVYNEYWSVLLRAVHSVLNRSPMEALEEIILVDDGSSTADMKKRLDDYVSSNLPKVRVLRTLAPRKGPIAAKLRGARSALGQVLVFLDSNVEVNVNWLPPLLDPIVENNKTCVCPVVDVINSKTFEIFATKEYFRQGFDWLLTSQQLPLLPEDRGSVTKPYKTLVMTGSAFAISTFFFWELGGYDTGLQMSGGEQYELSFKIWQCGGIVVSAPCSRIGHLDRSHNASLYADPGIGDCLNKNLKRVAEVWMDDFAEYVYMRKSNLRSIDVGDLSKQRETRLRLKCKPFEWFLEEVAFDLVQKYPPMDPADYGMGKITPLINNLRCLTVVNEERVELAACLSSKNEQYRQDFLLSWLKDIEVRGTDSCLTVSDDGPKTPVYTHRCRRGLDYQVWRYNLETKQLMFGKESKRCLAHDHGTGSVDVFVETCDESNETQKWVVGSINLDALKKWKETEPFVEDF